MPVDSDSSVRSGRVWAVYDVQGLPIAMPAAVEFVFEIV